MIKIILSTFFSLLILTNIFAQDNTIYNLSIKDENGTEIGQYFNIQIDSINISYDTTLNFQMIPNLGIHDSTLQIRYTSFLEMLRRNTAKELEAVLQKNAIIGLLDNINRNWGSKIDVYVGNEYNGTHNWVKQILNEINDGLGKDYFVEVAQPTNTGWNFDYTNVDWKLERNIEKEINFDNLGNPKNCTFKIYGLYKYKNDFKNRLKNQIISTLFLYDNFDHYLLESIGVDSVHFEIKEFGQDFLNILNVINSLENGINWNHYSNEINRSPVSNAGSNHKDKSVGEIIILDGASSFDPDGSIISYRWQQIFGTKHSTNYMTSNKVELSDSIVSAVNFTPQLPGKYVFKLKVTDNNGTSNEDSIDVSVFFQDNENPIDIKGISLGTYYDPNYEKLIEYFEKMKSLNVKSICINPNWWMPDINSNEIHPLDTLGQDLPKGLSWGDGRLRKFIRLAHQENFTIFLKPMIGIYYWAGGAPDVEPSNWNEWFDSYKNFINHYANIAEQMNVELFSVGTELSKTEGFTDKWKEVISGVRNIYNGEITYSAATTYIDNYSDLIAFWDSLDFIGIDYYVHGSGNRELGTGILDPTMDQMMSSFENNFKKNIKPVIDLYGKDVIFTEFGCSNMDGANQLPWFWNFSQNESMDNKEQKEYYESVLKFVQDKSWFKGLYVWEINFKSDFTFQQGDIPLTLSPLYKPAEGVIKHWYK